MRFKTLSILVSTPVIFFGIWITVRSDEAEVLATLPTQASEDLFMQEAETAFLEPSSPVFLDPTASILDAEAVDLLAVVEVPTSEFFINSSTDYYVSDATEYDKSEGAELTYKPHFSAQNTTSETEVLDPIRQNQIEEALSVLPLEHAQSTQSITLDYSPQAHRGLAGGGLMYLRAVNISTEEFVSVMVHEMGHNVDSVYLDSELKTNPSGFVDGSQPVYTDDLSVEFYQISWASNTVQKSSATQSDFVSGYAMSDPFEDFSEHYNAYILNGPAFREAATSSMALQEKYDFMKTHVFDGQEFYSGGLGVDLSVYHWDMTKLAYDYEEFMSL